MDRGNLLRDLIALRRDLDGLVEGQCALGDVLACCRGAQVVAVTTSARERAGRAVGTLLLAATEAARVGILTAGDVSVTDPV